jgi:hypothetical protein
MADANEKIVKVPIVARPKSLLLFSWGVGNNLAITNTQSLTRQDHINESLRTNLTSAVQNLKRFMVNRTSLSIQDVKEELLKLHFLVDSAVKVDPNSQLRPALNLINQVLQG